MKKIKLMLAGITVSILVFGFVLSAVPTKLQRSKSEQLMRPLPETPTFKKPVSSTQEPQTQDSIKRTQSLRALPSTKEAADATAVRKAMESSAPIIGSKIQEKIEEESKKEAVSLEGPKKAEPLAGLKQPVPQPTKNLLSSTGSGSFTKTAHNLNKLDLENPETTRLIDNTANTVSGLKAVKISEPGVFNRINLALGTIKKSVNNKLGELAKRIDDFKGDNPVKNALLTLKGKINEAALGAAEKNLDSAMKSDYLMDKIQAHIEMRKALAALERCTASTTMPIEDITQKKIWLNNSFGTISEQTQKKLAQLTDRPGDAEMRATYKKALADFGKARRSPETRLAQTNEQLRTIKSAIKNQVQEFKSSITNLLPARKNTADLDGFVDLAEYHALTGEKSKLMQDIDSLKHAAGKAIEKPLKKLVKKLGLAVLNAGNAKKEKTEAEDEIQESKVEAILKSVASTFKPKAPEPESGSNPNYILEPLL